MNLFKKACSFAQIFFHDIKNKLGSIKFSLSLLKNPKLSEEEKKLLIDSVIVTIDKAIDILHDFIDLEKYKKEKFLKNEKINLKELIKEIVEELKIDIKRKKIEVKVFANNDNLTIIANKKWLKKALLNIIHNSIKYNKDFGHVFIYLSPERNGTLITIKDTGIGMSEEEKEKVFQKYYTSGKEYGTGLGLSMSKAVIESIGGAIAIESEKGKGTKFYILLPKISKKVKIKRLASLLSGLLIVSFLGINYFYCLLPQHITKEISGDIVIYKIQNGIIAKTYKNDKVDIIAKRNLFGTKTITKFIVKKADIDISTNSKPIIFMANNLKITNMGTKFETVVKKHLLASSVYEGKIKAKNYLISQDKGLIYNGKNLKTQPLPTKISNINIRYNYPKNITVLYSSEYNDFLITVSKSKNFSNPPIYKYKTSLKYYTFNNLNDGYWYIKIQAIKDSLYSIPVKKKFLSLLNYYKAKKAYEQNNIPLAQSFLTQSLMSIKNDSYKPYALQSQIFIKEKDYKNALKYAKKAYDLSKNAKNTFTLAKIYYLLKNYRKSLKLLNKLNSSYKINELKAYIYYKTGQYKKAQKFLLKILEKRPNNKTALKYLIDILKKTNQKFLLNVFENQFKESK
jgi:tetratricopeptide (TPR) repeat protein/two-component sensor histidine kinase